MSFKLWCRVLLQVSLIFTEFLILVLGLLLVIVGTWYHAGGNAYFTIAASATSYSAVAALIILIGLFLIILGVLGTAGAAFTSTTGGRIILLLHAAMMLFIIVFEVINGINAFAMKEKVNAALSSSANSTLRGLAYGVSGYSAWTAFEQKFSCCGLNGSVDWVNAHNVTLQHICCASQNCTSTSITVLPDCIKIITKWTDTNMGGVAGIATTVGFVQIFSVLISCILMWTKFDTKS